MQISKICLDNFMVAGSVTLQIPNTGVVVLCGQNGAGKSRFIEAVAYARSGKTLRKESPWRQSTAGSATITFLSGDTERVLKTSVSASGKKQISLDGQSADTYQKSLDKITGDLGDHQIWRRAHVFSSSDTSSFTNSTDGERKNLVERILNLEVFDRAFGYILAEETSLQDKFRVLERTVNGLQISAVQLKTTAESIADLPPFVESPFPVNLVPEQDPNIASTAQLELQLFKMQVLPPRNPITTDFELNLAELQREVTNIRNGHCPTCKRVYTTSPAEKIAELKVMNQQYAELDSAYKLECEVYKQAFFTVRNYSEQLLETLRQYSDHKRSRETWQKAAADHAKTEAYRLARHSSDQEQINKRRELAQQNYARAQANLNAAQSDLLNLELQNNELTWIKNTVKLVRSRVLTQALSGLQDLANYWLQLMQFPGKIKIASCTETSSGKFTDKIDLSVVTDQTDSYDCLSGGQRRRIDIAILLALAEITAAATGEYNGTLFLDEVFDALDEVGQDAVSDLLAEISKSRAIVVITHSEYLARRITAIKKYVVRNGALEVI